MSSTTLRCVFTLAIAAPAALGAQAPPHGLTLQPGSHLIASGTSNVKDFACRTDTMGLAIATTDPDASRAIVGGSKVALTATLEVAAAGLDCNNGTMNSHMRDALKIKDHPNVRFRLESYTLAKTADSATATLHGALTLGDSTKAIIVVAHVSDGPKGTMRVVGSYDLLMSDYGLKPPTLMLGVLKVHQKVTVAFDLLLKTD